MGPIVLGGTLGHLQLVGLHAPQCTAQVICTGMSQADDCPLPVASCAGLLHVVPWRAPVNPSPAPASRQGEFQMGLTAPLGESFADGT